MSRLLVIILFGKNFEEELGISLNFISFTVALISALPLVYSHCPIGAKCQSESHGNPIKVTHTKASIKVKLNSPEHLFNSDNNTESIEKHEHEQNISASIDHSNLNINSTIDSTSSPDKNDSSHAASNIDANGEKIGVKIEQNATIPSGFPTDNTTSTNETSTITVDGHNSNFTEAVGNTTHSESSSNGTDSTVNGNSISSANVSAEGNISHSISEFPSTSEPREPIATSATSFPIVGENSTSNATDNKIDSNSTTGEPHNENKTYSTAASTELPFETTKEPQTSQFPSLNVTDHTNESKNETSLGSTTSPFIDTTDKHNQSISGATESPFDHTNEKGNHSNVAFTELPFTGTNEPHFSPFPSSIGTTEGEKMNSTESPLNGTSKSSIDHTETPNQTEIPILGSTSSSGSHLITSNVNLTILIII